MLRDEKTGLLSRSGFLFLTEHLVKIAERGGHGMLLISLGVETSDGLPPDEGAALLAEMVVRGYRGSDIKARVSDTEVVVLAIDAPSGTARLLTDRLRKSIDGYNRTVEAPRRLAATLGVTVIEAGKPHAPEDLLAKGRAARVAV